jgi:outer membrane protein OmpA-like peptidoglycan-associated protein
MNLLVLNSKREKILPSSSSSLCLCASVVHTRPLNDHRDTEARRGAAAKTSRFWRALCGGGLVSMLFLSGCASRSQLAKLAAEKEQLVAAIDSEKKLNADLSARLTSASDRAAQAERELAQLDGGKSARSAGSLVSTPSRSSSTATTLEQWSRSHSWLKYDSKRRVARVDLDVAFDDQDRLTMDARRGLHQVADLLVSGSAARYSIAVTGIKETGGQDRAARRAEAVAQWLQSRGVAADRVAVSTRDSASLLDEDGRKLKTPTSVALEIVEGPADAVANEGWTSSGRR